MNKSLLLRTHWIFDLDGTLTLPIHDFEGIRKKLGLPDKCDILTTLAEMPLAQSIPLRKTLDEIEVELAKKTQPALGVKALLSHLKERGCQLGILTRNKKENARLSLEILGVDSFFTIESILGREEANHKPDPDGIFKLLSLWDIPSDQAVMVGDYLFDLKAGHAAGTATIHIDSTGQFQWKEWMDIGVSTLEELCHKIENAYL